MTKDELYEVFGIINYEFDIRYTCSGNYIESDICDKGEGYAKGEDADKLVEALYQLSLYFTSGNNIPVDKATIKTEDFCRITGIDISKLMKGGNK